MSALPPKADKNAIDLLPAVRGQASFGQLI
jgi:hypothetical protein